MNRKILRLKKKLPNTIKAALGWLDSEFPSIRQNNYPFIKGIRGEVEEVFNQEEPGFDIKTLRFAMKCKCKGRKYTKALRESEYRYMLDGTPVKRDFDDEKKSGYDYWK